MLLILTPAQAEYLKQLERPIFDIADDAAKSLVRNKEFFSEKLKLSWPISQYRLLTRFGTPTISHFQFSDGELIKSAYFHDGVDIAPEKLNSDAVLAPCEGMAAWVYDGVGANRSNDYRWSVLIYHKDSGLFVLMTHVAPLDRATTVEGKWFSIRANQQLGHLAKVTEASSANMSELRHVHLSVLDLTNRKILDPTKFLLPKYQDNKSPVIVALNRRANEILLEAYDEDGSNKRHFEIRSLEFKIYSETGEVLYALKECDLTQPVSDLDTKHSTAQELLDIKTQERQLLSMGPSTLTDAHNPNRTFTYRILHLENLNGKCGVTQSPLFNLNAKSRIILKGKASDGLNIVSFESPL